MTQSPAPIREALIVAPEYILEDIDQEVSPVVETSYQELSALPDEDVWQRIRGGFAMKPLNNRLIQRHEKWYASHPEYVLRMSERANRYLYYIVEEVERRGMPSEIALLPIIESAFNPGANSVASASGIWQFIPSTGKHFGMEQNWWYDGRRDIIGATNGALDYLEKLHKQFGDWELALAAYNYPEVAELVHKIGSQKIVVFTNPQEESFRVGELFIYGLMVMIFYPLLGLILSLKLYKPS